MSLYGVMRTSVSGMAAQASRLAVVADNIANSGTIGYKRSEIEFHTQVLDSQSGAYTSGSVATTTRARIGEQGAIKGTTSATDLAISGEGFFVVQDPSGVTYLTRAGSFLNDSDGNLVNSAGNILMGYDLSSTSTGPVSGGFGTLVPINVGSQSLVATETTEGELLPNLPANAAIVAAASLPSANAATAEYSGKTSTVVYDSLGNERTIDIYFAKSAAETWEVTAYDASGASATGFPYSTAILNQATLTFDPTTGYVVGGGSTQFSIPIPGGSTMDLDMTGISQLGTDYQVLSSQTNGSSPASIERVEINANGTVYGIFQNGFAKPVYQLAIAKVPSPDNLRTLPGNTFAVTVESGDVLVGTAQSHGFGSIVSSALEESNVDMASELTIMIESQRSYTANSKVFQTGSDLMDVLVNLKR